MKTRHLLMHRCGLAVVSMLLIAMSSTTWAEERESVEPRTLIVGTKHSPPFAFKNADGEWTGISIELWKHLTDELNLDYELRELSLDAMFEGLESGELDAAVAAISVTAERHQRVDFCHPHFTTGLGIAVSNNNSTSSWTLIRRMASPRFLLTVGGMIAAAVVCGLVFWLLERKHNETTFGGKRRQGIGMGVWWSTVLLLGHKGVVPVSFLARIVAAGAMVSSILLISSLTGMIASILTVQQLDSGIEHQSELKHVRVVTVASSTSADYLQRRRIGFKTCSTAELALQDVADHQADAAVYDEALLKYLANTEFANRVRVLPISFNMQDYAIALRLESPFRKPLNAALLSYRASDQWDDLVFRYLGD